VGVVVQEITDRMRAERQLRESQERLMAALAASDTGTFRWDPSTGTFLEFGENLKRLFGVEPDQTIRTTEDFVARVHPDDRPRLLAAIERSRHGADFEMEYRVVLPGGGIRWLYDRAKMIHDAEGRPVYLVGACTDITKRRQVEEALKDADRRKDEFLATLAHELRNPLAPLRNGLQVIHLAGDIEETRERTLTMMGRQVSQMVRLIDDLLDVSRITSGRLELRKEWVELAAVVEAAIETSRPVIEASSHNLTVELPPVKVLVNADRTRLAQVLSNLLTNAAKYTEPGGDIRLAAEQQDGEVVITVRDNGIGIPADMLPRVFEMFAQVHRSLERSQGGLGIGLTLAKRLVEKHGGSIEARSEGEGKGSTLTVRLPAAVALPPAGIAQEDDRRRGALPKRRIVVADDNEDSAASLAQWLELKGNEVRTAGDGLEAVAVAEVFHPDVILLDIGMPKLNGYDAARRIREQPWSRGVVLIALTGWGQEEDRRRAMESGFDHHLVKPVDPAVLEELLAQPQVA
jgi:PAS domain S-box-containing protein